MNAISTSIFERLALNPSHSYLLHGSSASSLVEEAREFSALLIDADERSQDLVQRSVHPDVVEFVPEGLAYKISDIREKVIPATQLPPVESPRKVIVIQEAEKLRGNSHEATNAFLKTLEEPPGSVTILLLTTALSDLLDTVISRCQVVALDTKSPAGEETDQWSQLAGGDLALTKLLRSDWQDVAQQFMGVADRKTVDPASSRIGAISLNEVLEETISGKEQEFADQLVALGEQLEAQGFSRQQTARQLKQTEENQKRILRRLRTEILRAGLACLGARYRDVFVGDSQRRCPDFSPPAVSATQASDALKQVALTSERLLTNEKGTLQLERLLMALPSAA